MRYFIFLVILIMGCSRAWLIRSDGKGGVVGYENFHSREAAVSAAKKKIPCPHYQIVQEIPNRPLQNRRIQPPSAGVKETQFMGQNQSGYSPSDAKVKGQLVFECLPVP